MFQFFILILLVASYGTSSFATGSCKQLFLETKVSPLSGAASTQPANISDLIVQVKKDLTQELRFRRVKENQDLVWRGPSRPSFTRIDTSFDMQLTANSLRHSKDIQYRDVLTEIIIIYLQLNMEQGRRFTVVSKQMKFIAEAIVSLEEPLRAGRTKEVLSRLEQIKSKLEELKEGKGLLFNPSEQSPRLIGQKMEWPEFWPMERSKINEIIADLILQAYKVTGSSNPRATLIEILNSNAQVGMLQGRSIWFSKHLESLLSQINNIELFLKIQETTPGNNLESIILTNYENLFEHLNDILTGK